MTTELRDLPGLLTSNQVDFLVSSQSIELPGLNELRLGEELNQLVRPARKSSAMQMYLDHDREDRTTLDFLKLNGRKTEGLRRSYLNDVETILEAVELGLGQAVVPVHLASRRRGVRVVGGLKALRVPVMLYSLHLPYYTKLHQAVSACLAQQIPAQLAHSAKSA